MSLICRRHERASKRSFAKYLQWSADHPVEMYYLAYRHESEIIEVAQERDKLSKAKFLAQLRTWLQPFIEHGGNSTIAGRAMFRPLVWPHGLSRSGHSQ